MPTTAVYDMIQAELASGELKERERAILELLLKYQAGIDRPSLVLFIDGYMPRELNTDRNDRKNRLAIAALRDRLIPIVSSSGEAGYRLDMSEQALETMRAEYIHRRDHSQAKVEQIDRMLHIGKWRTAQQVAGMAHLRQEVELQPEPVQPRLI